MDETALENIPRFSWGEIKKRISERSPFEAISPMGTVLFRVKTYEPWLGLAAHAGHRVREELIPKMGIDENERLYEEDAYVDYFISSAPIQIVGLDSRFEYDVNRARDHAVYLKPFESWGKKVWKTPPTKDELELSYQKYDEFHELLDYFVEQMTGMFEKILVMDMHSYNYKRQTYAGRANALPLFNLGTTAIDRTKHKPVIEKVLKHLGEISLPGIPASVAENDVFKGNGAIASAVASKYSDSLLLNIEVKKVYMNETTGELHPSHVKALSESFAKLGRSVMQGLSGGKK